jgi:uncharacterized protein YgiM (DUF1202 family)
MIVFLTVFCLTAIFNIQLPIRPNVGESSHANDAVATESEALVEETQENVIQPFSYSTDQSIEAGEQYLASREARLYQTETSINQKVSRPKDAVVTNEDPETTSEETDTTEIIMHETDTEGTITDEPASEPIHPIGEKEPLYANIGISVAKEYVNIREKASTDSPVLGKLYRDSAAEIIATEGDWYYVESGSVKGYAKADYIKTGISDDELIKKYSVQNIYVAVDGLNVREEPATESRKLTVVYLNESYPVVELNDDWILIDITDENMKGYVKREFADLVVEFKDAVSKEEEKKLLQLAAEERARKATEVKYRDGVTYCEDDLKLLACLVHAEAGTQSYEGKLAVANVVLNRVKSSKYPSTIKSVIYQSGQFSVAASGSLEKQLSNYSNYTSNSQKLSMKAAREALEGANNIGSRLYFHSYKAAVKKGYDSKSDSVKIQDHLFW